VNSVLSPLIGTVKRFPASAAWGKVEGRKLNAIGRRMARLVEGDRAPSARSGDEEETADAP
jgi:hypothetical protein